MYNQLIYDIFIYMKGILKLLRINTVITAVTLWCV